MNQTIIKLVFFFLPLVSSGQNNLPLGQGILKIDYTRLPTLHFFTDTLQASPAGKVSITRNKEGEYVFRNPDPLQSWFIPESVSFDYDIFLLRVDTILGKWYRVVTNSDRATFMWTKASPEKQFISWEPFLKKETTAISIGSRNLEIRAGPGKNTKLIRKMDSTDCFEVLEIRGDWMKIRTNTVLECSESKSPVKEGWIKWRDNGRLTIEYHLTC